MNRQGAHVNGLGKGAGKLLMTALVAVSIVPLCHDVKAPLTPTPA